eukprot:3865936-Amphidinium_carterae.1
MTRSDLWLCDRRRVPARPHRLAHVLSQCRHGWRTLGLAQHLTCKAQAGLCICHPLAGAPPRPGVAANWPGPAMRRSGRKS